MLQWGWGVIVLRRNKVAEGGYWIAFRPSVSLSVRPASITLKVLVRNSSALL